MKTKNCKTKEYIPAMLVVVVFIAIVEALSRFGLIKGFILPAPSATFVSLFKNFGEMRPHLLETLWVSMAGFMAGIAVAFVTAVVMDQIPGLKKTLYPLLVASQTIPIMVITPIIILLIGFGLAPKILVVILVCFFPICISFYDGLSNADSDMLMLMKSMGAKRLQVLRHVKLPSSMPSFFSGIRISATYCIMATVIAEWQGSNKGLGVYMIRVKRSYMYEKMFASILLIVLLSLGFFLAAQIIEKKSIRWKK